MSDRRGPGGSGLVPSAATGAGVLALAASVSALVWAAGELAGRLVEGRWPPVPPEDAPVIAWRVPQHLGQLSAAWPARFRPWLDGSSSLLAAVLAGAVLLLGAVGAAILSFRSRVRPAPGWQGRGGGFDAAAASIGGGGRLRTGPSRLVSRRQRSGGARWATRRDLRALRVPGPQPGRLVLGEACLGRGGRGPLVATEARHSVLVVGATQSGKTMGLAVPAILEWEGPVIATSVKGDLAQLTLPWRRSQGLCWVFDPTASSGLEPTSVWSPLCEARSWSGAQRVASWLVEATPARGGLSESAFWFAASAKLLAPLLLAAERGGLGMADIVRWTNASQFEEPASILALAGCWEAAGALAACEQRDERIRSSVTTTLETVLAPWEDPVVARRSEHPDIDPDRLLAGSHTLYLCGPASEQHRVQSVFATLVASVVAAAMRRANQEGALQPALLVVLDEAANIAPFRDLDTLASTGSGLGIQLVTVCQDLAQLATRYGRERSRTITNNHRAKIILSGVSDLDTLDLVSGLAGDQAVRDQTVTADLRDGRRTTTTSTVFRRLASTDQLRRLPPGSGMLVYGHLPACRLRLRPWFSQGELYRRVRAGQRASESQPESSMSAPSSPSPNTITAFGP